MVTRVFTFAGAALALSACSPGQSPVAPAPHPPHVGVIEVRQKMIEISSDLIGRVRASEEAEVRPEVSGLVTARFFKEGDAVHVGQVLYSILADRYQVALHQAQAQEASAKAAASSAADKSSRTTALLADMGISRQEAADARTAQLQAEASLRAAEAEVEAARINLRGTEVHAPIAGIIGSSTVGRGSLVVSGQTAPLAVIEQIDRVYVDIKQSAAAPIPTKIGGRPVSVRVSLPDGSGGTLSGAVESTSVNVEPASEQISVRALTSNPSHALLPGSIVHANLDLGSRLVLLVPQTAVIRGSGGQTSVLAVNRNGVAETRSVALGDAVGTSWIATQGLSAGDMVIVRGTQRVSPGQSVVADLIRPEP